jgi:hypothetical protein
MKIMQSCTGDDAINKKKMQIQYGFARHKVIMVSINGF